MSTQVTLKGRLTNDPELKFTKSGEAIVNVTVVTSRNRRLDDGSWKEEDTTFWPVTVWGQDGEAVAESLNKGDMVLVVGDAKQRTWEDTKTGEKRSRTEVRARDVAAVVSRRQRVRVERLSAQAASDKSADPWASKMNADADPWATQKQTEEPPF